MNTYVIKSELGFLSAIVNGSARWSTEYPDALTYSSPSLARRTLHNLTPTTITSTACIVQDYGLDSEQTHPRK